MNGKHFPHDCSANFPNYEPIGNAEKILSKCNGPDLLEVSTDLIPSVVTTDNDVTIAKGLNEALHETCERQLDSSVQKQDCTIHVSRAQKRLRMSMSWSTKLAGKLKSKERSNPAGT